MFSVSLLLLFPLPNFHNAVPCFLLTFPHQLPRSSLLQVPFHILINVLKNAVKCTLMSADDIKLGDAAFFKRKKKLGFKMTNKPKKKINQKYKIH